MRRADAHELMEEYLVQAIENLRAAKIEVNKELSRPQLKELARRMGCAVHSAMDKDELRSLITK